MPQSFDSYAKFNLYLAVLEKRPDGYHEVDTVLQSVSLRDRITFEPRQDARLEVLADGEGVPSGEENLVWKALALLRARAGCARGMRVSIRKRIPTRAGLGGGSSNAACALCAANRIWGLDLSDAELERLGAEIGSDVPFFVRGGTQRCRGRGEKLEELPPLPASSWVIVKPPKDLATAAVYARVTPGLTSRRSKSRILLEALAKRELSGVLGNVFNDLEGAAMELRPEAAQAKTWLGHLGLQAIVLAGSGSAWVGRSPDLQVSRRAAREGRLKGWRVFQVKPTKRGWSEAKNGIQ